MEELDFVDPLYLMPGQTRRVFEVPGRHALDSHVVLEVTYTPKLERLVGKKRKKPKTMPPFHFDLAPSAEMLREMRAERDNPAGTECAAN